MRDVKGRRAFLKQSSVLLAGLAAGCHRAKEPPPAPAAPAAEVPPRPAPEQGPVLSELQKKMLDAATARILPTDQDPGAHEAGVVDYLDRELGKKEMAEVKRNVLAGVVALSRFSQKLGKAFPDLTPDQQDEVLHQVQQSGQRGADFMALLVSLTLEGFLGDPKYGGNRDLVGFKLAGYSPIEPHHHG